MPSVAPFTISRVFNAPRALVYLVHTDPKHLAQWMGPEGFKSIHTALDFKVGGTHHYGIEGPGGMQMWGKQFFREIVPNEKLVYLQSFSDKDGGLTRHPMAATWPLEMLATTSFEDAGPGQTRLTISWQPYNADEASIATFDGARAGMDQGFGGTFVKLEAYLAQMQAAPTAAKASTSTENKSTVSYPSATQMVFTRVLNAPRQLVWKAHTDPVEVLKWWGPEGFRNTTHEMTVKVGGVWKLTMHGPDGTDYPNKITYLEVNEPARLVMDHGDFDKVHFRVETDFIAEGQQTRLVTKMTFADQAQRDARASFGVPGHESAMRRLEGYLAG